MGNIVPMSAGAVPAHIAARRARSAVANTDLSFGVSAGFPVISYKGKVWRINQGGDSTLLTVDGKPDGDPTPSLQVVLIRANPHMSKTYYAQGFVEGTNEKPTCYSNDGVKPEADSAEMQNPVCATCQWNQWGSRISENSSKGKACADVRRLAVAPAGDIENPMLLRVPAASLKEVKTYADVLNKHDVDYNSVVTKISFDNTVAHPQFKLKGVGYLGEDDLAKVDEMFESDTVRQILGLDGPTMAIESHVAAQPSAEDEMMGGLAAPQKAAAATGKGTAVKPKAAAKPKASMVSDDEVAEALQPSAGAKANGLVGDAFSQQMKAAREEPDAEEPTGITNQTRSVIQEIDGDADLSSILAELDD
jgi:hypothetical protein